MLRPTGYRQTFQSQLLLLRKTHLVALMPLTDLVYDHTRAFTGGQINTWGRIAIRGGHCGICAEETGEYFSKWTEADCAGDELSAEDWIVLEKVKSFLEKLKMTTKALESSFATLDNVLLAMDFMLAQFEAGKEAHKGDPMMGPMYNSGWAKLDKYYRLTDESPAYVAAIVLHPSHKWHYIQENWKTEWVESSKKLLQTLWNEYRPVEPAIPFCETPSMTTNEFLNWRNKHLQPSLIRDEYERYCKSERVYGFTSALSWWLEETQRKNYPNLSKMAVDILSIPAMSAEPERLFSGAKTTITDRRNRLGRDVIEALECLKSWLGLQDIASE
ncbi:hypothetical protein Purlil1_13996 [Purpureocillium lilacinum]|uniref:HAT C-terminal dimerisation domain-containing protein n=1 Tax=Purpureocillium lilacinum TaxID=33203 RepID=A0ABR0BCI8_PURLI|nr:hypothetical protein Purlil1_13996 [Purpureocillium lilacinum]